MKLTGCIAVAVLIVMAQAVSGCNDKSPGSQTQSPSPSAQVDPHWVYRSTPNAKIAVVFIHGIIGDLNETWTNAGKKITFFDLLKQSDDVGSKVDIFAFGYPSRLLSGGSFTIGEAAKRLRLTMEANSVTQYPKVVFVAHSMGGLIAMQYLLTYEDARQKTPLLVMFATPQEGAQVTNILKAFPNSALAQMLPADSNPYLQELDDKWKEFNQRPKVVCAYEKLVTGGLMVVGVSSSTRFCDGASPAIDASHVTIVKPDRPKHDSVLVLVNALNKYVAGKQLEAKVAMPDFKPEQDHFVFIVKQPRKNEARLSNESEGSVRYTLTRISDENLYLFPDDTPKEIPPRVTEKVKVLIGRAPVKPEYEFTILIPELPDRRVVVRIEDMQAFQQNQIALMQTITRELSDYVSANKNVLQTAADPKELVADAARRSVARQMEGLPSSAQWVLTADLLANANLPDLASVALKSARRVSPEVVKNPGARRLAAIVAKQSGTPNVFDLSPMLLKPHESAPSGLMKLMVDSKAESEPNELAKSFQGIPSLRASGFSLEADVLLAKGKSDQAKVALEKAHALDKSPLVSERLVLIRGDGEQPAPRMINPKLNVEDWNTRSKAVVKGNDKAGEERFDKKAAVSKGS